MARAIFPASIPRLRLVSATLLVLLGVGSLIVDALVIAEVWHVRQALDQQLTVSVQLVQDTLATSDDTLVVLDGQIQTMSSVANTAGSAAHTTTQVIDTTHQSLQSAVQLLRTEMPATLDQVHAAVVSAQSAATIVDSTLGALSAIPGLTNPYNPPVPLHVSLGNLAQSMQQLPVLAKALADNLASTDAALPEARRNVTSVAQSLEQNPSAATQLHQSVAQYRDQVAHLKREVSNLQVVAAQWMTWIAIAVTFFVVWIAVAHAAILLVALGWLRHDRPRPNAPEPIRTTSRLAESPANQPNSRTS